MPSTAVVSPGLELRRERERLGVSRAELAGLAGVSISQLGHIEQGAVPSESRVLKLALAVLHEISRDSESDD